MRAILILMAALLLGACSPKTVYVPTESEHLRTDTVYKALWRVDTVIDRDTVNTIIKGDSVIVERIRWRWRTNESHDTVYRAKTDTLYKEIPYPVEHRVEVNVLRWWQTALMWLGGIVLVLCAGYALRKIKR